MNDYSIEDISMVPWVNCCTEFYDAWDHLDTGSYKNVEAWRKQIRASGAVHFLLISSFLAFTYLTFQVKPHSLMPMKSRCFTVNLVGPIIN